MRARINVRFLLILFVVGAGIVGALGAAWYLKTRSDATRHVTRGEEFLAEGDYRTARTFFARAVGREPANEAYLDKLESTLLSIRPETTDEARELYRDYIGLLDHAAHHLPLDADRHLALLEEVHEAARRGNSWVYAEHMLESADAMWSRLPSTDPRRIEAKFFSGAARMSAYMHDRLSEEEVSEGESQLLEYVAEVPGSDRGWATLILGRLASAERLFDAGQLNRAEEVYAQVDEALREAGQRVTDGPEVALAGLRVALGNERRGRPAPDDAALIAEARALAEHVADHDDPWLIGQTAQVLDQLRGTEGAPLALDVIESHLVRSPDAHDLRLIKASLQYFDGDLEDAERTTQEILDAELLPVSYLSQLLFVLKQRAATLNVDIAARRWDLAAADDKEAMVAAIEKRRDELLPYVTEPENDPAMLRAEAKVAFAHHDFATAAALFNRLVREAAVSDAETLMYAAISLEQEGELGAAVQRVEDALEIQPENEAILAHQTGLLIRTGQLDRAERRLAELFAVNGNNEAGLRLQSELARRRDMADETEPIQAALRQAQKAVDAGEFDVARALLVAEEQEAPDDLRLINAMIRVEMAAGRTDDARAMLQRGLQRAPSNRIFLSLKAFLDSPDPIERIKQYVAEVSLDEEETVVETLHSLRQLAVGREAESAKLDAAGETAKAEAERNIAARARQEMDSYSAKMAELNPENPRYIEFRFLDAATREDWKVAEEVLAIAARVNADQADGTLFRGRYAAARGDLREAVRSFTEAVEVIPYSATAWRLLAAAHQRLGNFTEALRAFERSYTNNPNDIRTALAYAGLLSRTGNERRALVVLRDGRRLAPGDAQVREQWLSLEAAVGNVAVGLRERRRIFRDSPQDITNAAALAALLGRTKPARETLLDEDGKELYTVDRWNRLPVRGERGQMQIIAATRRQWHREADQILESIASEEERNLGWYILRAQLLRNRGEVDAGAEVLRTFAEKQTTTERRVTAMLAHGSYLTQVDRNGQAIEVFEAAREQQDPEARRGDLALGEVFFRLRRFDRALPHFDAVLEVRDDRRIALKAVECAIKLGQLDDARQRMAAIERSSGVDGGGLLLKATIIEADADRLLAAGDETGAKARYDEYIELLEEAARLSPSDPTPIVLQASALYKAAQRTGDALLLDDALRLLGRADEVQTDYPQTSLTRAAVLAEQGNMRGSINELARLVENVPAHEEGRMLLMQLLVREGRFDRAIEVAQGMIDLQPTSARWHVALADLYTMAMKETETRLQAADPGSRTAGKLRAEIAQYEAGVDAAYGAALNSVPSVPVLVKRVEAHMRSDPPRYNETIDVLGRYKKEFEASPVLRTIYARALAGTRRRPQAVAQLRLAYAQFRELIGEGRFPAEAITNWYVGLRYVFPPGEVVEAEELAMELSGDEPDGYELYSLSGLWRTRGRDGMSRSIELMRRSIGMTPEASEQFRARQHADLGVALILVNEYDAALEALETAVAITPNDGEVLNNLAYLLAERMELPRRGLPYAERAAAILSESGSVHDTLGWIHYRLDELQKAEDALRRSAELEATAENQTHLAYLYAKRGDMGRARRYLEQASELNPNPDTQSQIQRLLDDIRTGSGERQ